jgi:hypothetical protein
LNCCTWRVFRGKEFSEWNWKWRIIFFSTVWKIKN